ncbi:hypothetical protein FOA52_015854 [Chlamydomonas sp. UWO 241]|nr:hypothetical protein FOA52_015854 [Chlamydomonas sp. UWO 241]
MDAMETQAIVLAGGIDKQDFFPLCCAGGTPKALVSLGNVPLLHYPLRTLAQAGFKHAFVVVSGEDAAASIRDWISTEYAAKGTNLKCEVVAVPEGCGTADALRAVAHRIASHSFVVLPGDLVTDVAVAALVASHQMQGALASVTLVPRKISPASETKPGKVPRGVDYVGMDPSRERLLYYAASRESLRDLKLPMSLIRQHGAMAICSNLTDAHLYVFSRQVLSILEGQRTLTSLSQDVLPYLTQQQLKLRPQRTAILRASSGFFNDEVMHASSSSSENMLPREPSVARPLPGDRYMDLSHCETAGSGAPADTTNSGLMRVNVVDPGCNYCARVVDVQAYGDVSREVADPATALHLTGHRPSRYDNVVAASAVLGTKTTVAAACIVGEGCTLGDKSSIKRSVLGRDVTLGANVKVINSVLMDGSSVGDGCTIQNSILCEGVVLREKASLKDCQIGAGYVVAGGVEYKGEVLAKGAK